MFFKRRSNTCRAGRELSPYRWLNAFAARRKEKGQGFLELALSLIFLIILLSVVIDLGWAFFTMIALRDSVQEAGSAAAICPTNFTKVLNRFKESATAPIDMNKLEDNLIKIRIYKVNNATTPPTETNLCFYNKSSPSDPSPANCTGTWANTDSIMVEVKASYNHDIVTPLVGEFIGNKQQYTLSATSINTVLTNNCRIR